MTTARLRHIPELPSDLTIERAIREGLEVTAECGAKFVPIVTGVHTGRFPRCAKCTPMERDQATFVYRCYDDADRLIYVGCSSSPKVRMDTHRATSWWFPQVTRTRFVVFQEREYALMKEREAIGEERPRWNIKGRWNHRSMWASDDYRDYYTALLRSKGLHARHLAEVADEGRRRYGLDLEFEHALADTA